MRPAIPAAAAPAANRRRKPLVRATRSPGEPDARASRDAALRDMLHRDALDDAAARCAVEDAGIEVAIAIVRDLADGDLPPDAPAWLATLQLRACGARDMLRGVRCG